MYFVAGNKGADVLLRILALVVTGGSNGPCNGCEMMAAMEAARRQQATGCESDSMIIVWLLRLLQLTLLWGATVQ